MKDLVKLAQECGAACWKSVCVLDESDLARFRDAVLEEAADRCEDTPQEHELYTGAPLNLSYTCAAAIRSMKTNQGVE
jgi:hypothetical protein